MADYPSDTRRFTDKEMALILKIASELEPRGEATEGHSLSEIEQIAAEAGIDPELVARAANSLADRRNTVGSRLVGAPTTYRFQRSVPGELPVDELTPLLATIRRNMGHDGEANEVLGGLEWRDSELMGSSRFVEVAPRKGHTWIEVTGRYDDAAGWRYLAAAIVAMVVSVTVGTEVHAALAIEAGLIGGIWAAAYAGARALWGRIARKEARRLREVAETLAVQVAEMVREDADSETRDVSDVR